MEGEGEGSLLGGQWKVKKKYLFTSSHFSPNQFLLKPSIFPFDFKVLLYHGSRPLLMHSFPPWTINYDYAFQRNKFSTPSLSIWFWLKISSFLFEIMASRLITSYGPQIAQVNEKPTSESSLVLTLTQHPCDEDPTPREVRARLEVNPPRAWYYHISPNFHTLVILLQVDPASSDEPEIICEGCYETEDTSIFAWSSVPDVGHYRWLSVRFVDCLLIARQTT
jgi:hypothetical protein